MGYYGVFETKNAKYYVIGYHHGFLGRPTAFKKTYNEIVKPLRENRELADAKVDNIFIEFTMTETAFKGFSEEPFYEQHFKKARRENIPIHVMDVPITRKGWESWSKRMNAGKKISMVAPVLPVAVPAAAAVVKKLKGKKFTRRDFLKTAGVGAGAATVTAVVGQTVLPYVQAIALAVPGEIKAGRKIFFSWLDASQTLHKEPAIEGRNAIWAEKIEAVSEKRFAISGQKPINLIICDSGHLPGVVENLKNVKRRRKTLRKFLREGGKYYYEPVDRVRRFDPRTGKVVEEMRIPLRKRIMGGRKASEPGKGKEVSRRDLLTMFKPKRKRPR